MRLRLRIERNALPPTQALWPVKDAKCTIAQLLELINQIFPLEADTWGLEDYAVSIGGYECLHYYELGSVCKDEDAVVIKPLQYVDVRSRALTGRDQIAADGRHLVDGVPFGRPALRTPIRPEISIPPRKKRKLNLLEHAEESEDGEEEEEDPLMLMSNGEKYGDDDDEDEDDEDFDSSAGSSSSQSESSEDSDSSSDEESSDSDAKKGSDSDSEEGESWDGLPSSEPPTPSRKSDKSSLTNGVAKESGKLSRASRKQSSDDEEESDVEQGHQNKKRKQRSGDAQDKDTEADLDSKTPPVPGLPFEGKNETKRRNARRRDTKKLKNLIATGTLPKDSTLGTLQKWMASNEDGVDSKPVGQGNEAVKGPWYNVNFQEQRAKLMADIASGGVDVTAREQQKKKKQKKEKGLHSDTIPVLVEDGNEPPSEEENPRLPPTPLYSAPGQPTTDEAAKMLPQSTTPRSRLDVAGSKRLVFGSLGVRVPRTEEEKDELQKKLAGRPTKNFQSVDQSGSREVNGVIPADIDGVDQGAEGEEDEENWQSKINLTAVECSDEGVTLSTPPFPFHQRWDPQYRKKKAKNRVNGVYMQDGTGKKRKRCEYVETYDKYNVNGDGDALDYDDVADDEEEYWEEGALLYGEDEDGEIDEADEGDGFPALPDNIEGLPILYEKDACRGDFITFTELACDESTEWQPRMVARTAQILTIGTNEESDSQCWIQLSNRDVKPKVFDEEGNRVYSKFEMPDQEEEDDARKKSMRWQDIGIVRLVSRPEFVAAMVES